MNEENRQRKFEVIVIGAGQAALACGYHLNRIRARYCLIESNRRIGDSWRQRWDSLKLFTPGDYNNLPGDTGRLPETTTKDQMADYLESYAKRFSIPVLTGVAVKNLTKSGDDYRISTSNGTFHARCVIVATGNNPIPKIPFFASDLNTKIVQIHSSAYRNPGELPSGNVLVVGAGVSGIEIASEIAATGRRTELSGELSFVIPKFLFLLGRKLYWQFVSHVLTINTPIGRKARKGIIAGGTVFPDLVATWKTLSRLPRLQGVVNGVPQLANGRLISVSTIIWCTGFKPDFSWIDLNITDDSGWPVTERGITATRGLYFAGMPFQFGLTSGLVGGVGRDAEFVVNHIRDYLDADYFNADYLP